MTRFVFNVLGLLLLFSWVSAQSQPRVEKAVLGFGCFWCAEAIYERVPGVLSVVSGYAGGREENPTYSQVSSGQTSHAEVIEVEFDPNKVTYRQLVDLFWKTHDVTRGDGVWPDFGPQYRSIILPSNESQMAEALASREAAQKSLSKPIATEIAPLTRFYPAESYHQDYAKRNPGDRYIVQVLQPKLKKLESVYKSDAR